MKVDSAQIKALAKRFRKSTGYKLNLKNPLTYCEKIQWRKVHDRRPILPQYADKIAARKIVGDILGPGYLVPSSYVGYGEPTIEEIETTMLTPCVIKASHGCGWMVFQGLGGEWLDAGEIQSRIHRWTDSLYGVKKLQWAESQIPPGVVVESPMSYRGGQPLLIKIRVFDGVGRIGYVIEHEEHTITERAKPRSVTWYSRYGQLLDLTLDNTSATENPAPDEYAQCVALSEQLAAGIDHVRVDWLLTDEGVKFSEFEWYPTSGMFRLNPAEWDRIMGDWWTLPKELK